MNIYSEILFLFSVLIGLLSVYILVNRRNRGAISLSCLLFAVAIYSIGYAFELSSKTFEKIEFWLNIEYIGVSFIPALFVIFALQFKGRKQWLTRKLIYILLSISLATFVMHITNPYHHLFYSKMDLLQLNEITVMILGKGAWYWVHTGYVNIAAIISIFILISGFRSSSLIYRRQIVIMLAGFIGAWIVFIVYLLELGPVGIDLNPFGFMITCIFLAIGLFQYKLLRFEPIALNYVFESMKDGAILIDSNDNIVSFNPSAQKIVKNLSAISIGQPVAKEFSSIAELVKLVTCENVQSIHFSYRYREVDYYFEAEILPVKRGMYKLGRLITISDVSANKATELIMKNNEQKLTILNATKDKFFSIIAHDLREPLANIHTFLEMLTDKSIPFTQDEVRTNLLLLKESSKTTHLLVENLLTWARAQQGEISFNPAQQSVYDLIESNINLYKTNADSKEVLLISDVDPELYAYFDYDMIYTVVRNLINNALKYTREKGTVVVSAKEMGAKVQVSIKDSGIGMSKRKKDKLFRLDEKIHSTEGLKGEKGTGLGLILCKEFVEKNGGTISVTSELDIGSEFSFTLPISK